MVCQITSKLLIKVTSTSHCMLMRCYLVSVFQGLLNGELNDKASSYNHGMRYSILNLR
jgi:hypothetical protein